MKVAYRATEKILVNFSRPEILPQFEASEVIIRYHVTFCTARTLGDVMEYHGRECITTVAHVPVSNSRARQMIGTMEKIIRYIVNGCRLDRDQVLSDLFMYTVEDQ